MKIALCARSILRHSFFRKTYCFVLLAIFAIGCGGVNGTGTTSEGNTTVTLLASGTANDRLTLFQAQAATLSLTNESGQTVGLLSTPILLESIHENGTIEPFVTVSVPQGTYTSATITSSGGGFICETLAGGGSFIDNSIYDYSVPIPDVTVTLPAPVTVSGTSMGILLDMLVSESATFPSACMTNGDDSFTFTPQFALTPITLSSQPTNSANGKALELQGVITSIGTDGFTVTGIYDGNVLQVTPSDTTSYQGVTGSSQLEVGMPVDMDAAVQADGSLTATRVAVYDANPSNLSMNIATLLNSNEPNPKSGTYEGQSLLGVSLGKSYGAVLGLGNIQNWDYSKAAFQVSGELTNLGSLPFTARFAVSNMVAGQHVMLTTHESLADTASLYNLGSTVTLLPQTINGTVSGIGSVGNFTTYTVTLAPYDPFPQFSAQENQISVLADPDTIVVYADSNTQMLNTNPIAVGSVARFHGLVFNDTGTLRMDCNQINDGVAE